MKTSSFPLSSSHIVAAVLGFALIAMLAASVKATFTGISMVDAGNAPSEERVNAVKTPDAENPSGGGGLGMGFALSEKQSDTVSELMAQLRSSPNDAALLMRIGDVFMTVEDWNRALVFLKRAVVSAPSDTRPRFMAAVCQFRLGDAKGAAETFAALLDIQEEPQAMYNLGILYKYHLHQPDKAKGLFSRILASPNVDEELAAKVRNELP